MFMEVPKRSGVSFHSSSYLSVVSLALAGTRLVSQQVLLVNHIHFLECSFLCVAGFSFAIEKMSTSFVSVSFFFSDIFPQLLSYEDRSFFNGSFPLSLYVKCIFLSVSSFRSIICLQNFNTKSWSLESTTAPVYSKKLSPMNEMMDDLRIEGKYI